MSQVWKVLYDGDEREPDLVDEEPLEGEEEEEEEEPDEDEDEDGGSHGRRVKKEVFLDSADDEDLLDGPDNLLAHIPPEDEVDEYGEVSAGSLSAVTPWIDGLGMKATDLSTLPVAPPANDELHLEWVYGYASRLTRASVRYSAQSGTILYPAASMGVIYNKNTKTQKYSMHHKDEITALDAHPNKDIAATGHRARGDITVCVWNSVTGEALKHLNVGDKVYGISSLKFNADGRYLAVACQDVNHTVLIYDWEFATVPSASVNGGPQKILCLVFSLVTDKIRLLEGGVGHFSLLELCGNHIFKKTGQYGPDMKKLNITCAAALPVSNNVEDNGNEYLVGLPNGSIGVITRGEKKISNYVSVQSKAVTSLYVIPMPSEDPDAEIPSYQVITGGIDGLIKVLDNSFEPMYEYNLYNVKLNYNLHKLGKLRGIKSICCDKSHRKILYGTSGGEIGEIGYSDGKDINNGPLVQGHCRDQSFGLCAHPIRQECVTVGDDRTLRVWNLEKKTMISILDLPDIARVVTYSPTGQLIAVGLGGIVRGGTSAKPRVPRANDGKLVIISYLQGVLRTVYETQDAHGPITTIVFSPDGSKLYVGSLDGKIYIYDVLDNFSLSHTLDKHTAGVLSLDISSTAKYLASVDAVAQILLWDLEDLGNLVNDSKIRDIITDETWHVRNNTLSYESIGAFPSTGGKFSDLLALARSNDKRLFVTGDNHGVLKLFKNPSYRPNAPYKAFHAHSLGGISRVSISVKDQFVLSLGREDKVLCQWKLEKVDDILNRTVERPLTLPTALVTPTDCNPGQLRDFATGVPMQTLTFNSVNFSKEGTGDSRAPEVEMGLHVVLGVGAASCVSSVRNYLPQAYYCGSGDIVTAAGTVPYLLQRDRISQKHCLINTNPTANIKTNDGARDVSVVAVSSSLRYICVGEKSSVYELPETSLLFRAKSRVFDAATGLLVSVLPGDIDGGVAAIAFSNDDSKIACLGGDAYSSLTVFQSALRNWVDAIALFRTVTDTKPNYVLSFILQPDTVDTPAPAPQPSYYGAASYGPYHLVTGGEAVLRFWRINSKNTTSSAAEYKDKSLQPAFVTAAVSVKYNWTVTGDAAGSIYLWEGNRCASVLKNSHASAVSTLVACPPKGSVSGGTPSTIAGKGTVASPRGFISASSDRIRVWDSAGEPQAEYPLGPYFTALDRPVSKNAYVTSLSTDGNFNRLLVSTSVSVVFEIAMDTQGVFLISEGHLPGRFTAICTHPTDPKYLVSGGQDGSIRLWNLDIRRPIEIVQLLYTVTSVSFRTDGTMLAVAVSTGTDVGSSIMIMNFQPNDSTRVTVAQKVQSVGQGSVNVVRYSPDDSFLAAGSEDRSIYLFDVVHGYKLRGSIRAHSNPIIGLDFSVSGEFVVISLSIQCCTSSYNARSKNWDAYVNLD